MGAGGGGGGGVRVSGFTKINPNLNYFGGGGEGVKGGEFFFDKGIQI